MHRSVGIVTIFDCDNYGAELQAYALPMALAARGWDARLIDYPFYKSPRFRRTPLAAPAVPLAPINRLKECVAAARATVARRLAGDAARRRRAAFEAFRGKIPRTRLYATFDDLLRDPPPFEVYLTGSDQVWNPRMGATLRPYFLDFLPEEARRVAYAASFGVPALSPARRGLPGPESAGPAEYLFPTTAAANESSQWKPRRGPGFRGSRELQEANTQSFCLLRFRPQTSRFSLR